jgi:hypothetical protein
VEHVSDRQEEVRSRVLSGIERDERQNTKTGVAEGEIKERTVGEMEVRGSHNNRFEFKVGEYQHSGYPHLKERIKFRAILFQCIRNK